MPVPFIPADPTIPEVAAWLVNSTTDDPDIPANQLTYTKLGGPATMTVSASGQIAWTPTETHGPGNFLVTILVEDDGTPVLRATNTFLLGVVESNTPPSLIPPASLAAMELSPYSGQLGASDPDLPANAHLFALLNGPSGLTVSPSGTVAWTPTEAQGPANQVVTVLVTDIPAEGVTPITSTNSFTLVVGETNTAPVFGTITDPTLDELTPLSLTLTASDSDLPANTLTFSKVSGPAGLTVLPGGQVQWTPTELQGPSTNTVEVSVSDGGSPALTATATFQISVTE
ncbi:MAG: cadherin repeat domain-containing protein, partial [Verrucomicrobia bacterium]|nr:cadherin repeat domain-containing protein [Verrucomicrobiota bacterium]